ncbi:FKBP-type peptidyl-prolyl cis-trans isomerase [Nitrospira sp. Nam74]
MRHAQVGDTVRVHYTGKLQDGQVFDSSEGQDALEFTLGTVDVISGLNQAVIGMTPGESKTERIASDLAYGPYQEALCVRVDGAMFRAEGVNPEVGMQLQVPDADGQRIPVRVTDVSEGGVKLDANHPLAGKDLVFDITLVEIVKESGSDATPSSP